ncbi:MAG: LysR substrate-binding domain-containing protein [Halomonas sp.]|nr:LysR substrate-binding domain-containing protein [Halomonas sp.]
MPPDRALHLKSWLKLKHLSLLVALDESRNMHVAARQLHISQPAASKMLRDIEGFFGTVLFQRQARQMETTAIGERVLRYARTMLNDTDRLVDDLASLRQGGYSKLIIGVVPGAAPVLLPKTITALKSRRPELAVSLFENSSDRLLTELEYKLLDVVIGRFTNHAQYRLFDFLPLREEPVSLMLRLGHPLHGTTPPLSEVVRWPWVLHPMTSPMRSLFEAALAEAGIRSPSNVIETTSTQSALQLVAASDALTVQPGSLLSTSFSAGRFATLPITIGEPLSHYGIMTRKREPLSDAVSEFIETLTQQHQGSND